MNELSGIIGSILQDELFAQVNVLCKNYIFSACILTTDESMPFNTVGLPVILAFKETDTIITLTDDSWVSCRNRIPSRITELTPGKVMTRIVADFSGIQIISIITSSSASLLRLQTGMDIFCLIKSTSVTLYSKGVA